MKKSVSFFPAASRLSSVAIWFLLLCAAATFAVGEIWLGVAEMLLFLLLLSLSLSLKKRRDSDIREYVQRINAHLDSATKDTLANFPFPMVVAHLDGKVSWYNRGFADIVGGESLFERYLNEVFEDLSWSDVLRMQEGISLSVAFCGRRYSVMGSIIKPDPKREKEYLVLLYWLDVTEYQSLRARYAEEKTDLCIIMIDNYDDVMQATEDSRKPQLISSIDKRINDWVSEVGGVIKKTERDRYLLLFEHQRLEEFIARKFDVLDKVREIDAGNKTPATISIGIGTGGDSIADNDSYSRMALDMALGRGGDQAVIKDESQFSFYGGKTKEHEKSTRVKSRVVAYALRQLIESAGKVVIMGHHHPDVDSMGAAIGLSHAVRNRGKHVYIVCGEHNLTVENMLSQFYAEPDYETVFVTPEEAEALVDQSTTLVVVDTHRPSLTENPNLLKKAGELVVIDHHRRSTEFIENCSLVYHEPYASSSCELVSELLQYMDNKAMLTKKEAEALYAGICMDTKNFIFKTGVRTFDAAGFLRKHGVDTVAVKQMFQYDLEHYSSRAQIVKSAEFVADAVAIAICEEQIDDLEVIVSQAADELLNIAGISASFVLAVYGDEILISGRSLGEINVQVILEKLGGGGHMTVAGAQLHGVDMAKARHMLVAEIESYLRQEAQ